MGINQNDPRPITLEMPEGQVPLNSAFYIERNPIESDCYQTIIKPGSLIRIKAPRQMGKSSLMTRIMYHANEQNYQTVCLNLQAADGETFTNLDLFLQWFCASVTEELNREDRLGEYWKGVLGSKNKTTKYFQRYLLAEINTPLVLGLDEVDIIFQYPEVATDFFGLLRAWHERGKNEQIWQQLKLVIAHSKEVYIPLNINQSPFNVGLPIELPELSTIQVEELVKRHGLNWSENQVEKLILLTGGHPYLVRVALYQIALERISLDQLLKLAATEEGPYYDHLHRLLVNLENDGALIGAIKQVVTEAKPVQIGTSEAFKLRSMGLVKFQGNAVTPLCDLYRQYFREILSNKSHKTSAPANNLAQTNLAVIVFTDVVSSTRKMVANQTQMIELLTRDFQIMREICHQYEGKVIKSMGDGLLMYFVSAVKAVSCAENIQKTLKMAANNLPDNAILTHRIGIHLGDVVFSGEDVLGIGVNVASRIQSLSDPGGICISQTVYQVVKNHLDLEVNYLGPQELKGVPELMPLYRIVV